MNRVEPMTQIRDRALIGALSLALVVLSLAALAPTIHTAGNVAEPTPGVPTGRGYVEGVLGRATNASPFGARSAADRALVALLFRGLVRLGPGDTLTADLAASWDVTDEGRAWTFHLRPDQYWQDGFPITADDVAFTIETLRSPDYLGPGGESWRDVTPIVRDPLTVELHLTNPLGGFLHAATQPIAPAHLLGGVPSEELADDPFGRQPVGSGDFRLVFLDATRAFVSATGPIEPTTGIPFEPNFATPRPTDSFATPRPTARPDVPIPYLPSVELRYYDDLAALHADWESGQLDAVSGIQPGDVDGFLARDDARVVRYPGTTLLAATLDLQATRPDFLDPAIRRALLQAIDRDAIVSAVLRNFGVRADSLIPPSSSVFDAEAASSLPYSPEAARKGLADAGWKESGGSWIPKDATEPLEIELLCPEEATNTPAYETAAAIVAAWRNIGLNVRLVPLPASELLADRVGARDFQVAVVPVAIGLDPDVYPLLAASQTRTGGSNVAGLQDPDLDKLLVAARSAVDPEARIAAYAALQERLAAQQFILPIAFRDDYVVLRDTVIGPSSRPVTGPGDRYWDVLTWRLADGG